MTTKSIIEGLTILENYRDGEGGYNTGAEHDIIYAYPTDEPVSGEDIKRLIELSWFQPEVDFGEGDFEVHHYEHSEGWAINV